MNYIKKYIKLIIIGTLIIGIFVIAINTQYVCQILSDVNSYQILKNPIIAIGDPHANLNNFLKIGNNAGFLENSYTCEWKSGIEPLTIIQTGDIFDRGPDGVGIYNCIRHLQKTIPDGVNFITLVGNHELMVITDGIGSFPERVLYQDLIPLIHNDIKNGDLKAVHNVGHYLFSHAGFNRPFLNSIGFNNITSETTDLTSLTTYINKEFIKLFTGSLNKINIKRHIFNHASSTRGGPKGSIAGFLWSDWKEIDDSLHQIVGHSMSDTIRQKGNSTCIDAGNSYTNHPQYLYIDVYDNHYYKIV
jgi:hypothetical protein